MTEPDFVNEIGVKYWFQNDLTRYAFLKGLRGVRVWLAERPTGFKAYILTEDDTVLLEDQTLEGLGLKIDLMAFQKKAIEGENKVKSRNDSINSTETETNTGGSESP
jgi:hypothetical protein